MKKIIFGSDWGGVLCRNKRRTPGGRNPYLEVDANREAYLPQCPFAGSRETLRYIKEDLGGRIYVISRIDQGFLLKPRVQCWLEHYGFYQLFSERNVHFCAKREEKAPICARLKVTHFVDDRLEVLAPMVGIVPHLFLFRPRDLDEKSPMHLVESGQITRVHSWEKIRKILS